MATAGEKRHKRVRRKFQLKGMTPNFYTMGFATGKMKVQTRKELLHEAEKITIKPGMKLVWDEQLNQMVWK